MKTLNNSKQRGAVLVIALVMLLVLTLLATSSMRGTALDARITGNHKLTVQQLNMANAALREGELRLLDPFNIEDKLQYKAVNCSLENTLNKNGFNKPCLIDEGSIDVDNFFAHPIAELGDATNGSNNLTWIPYRGLDADKGFNLGEKTPQSYWSIHILPYDNQEYSLDGKGTYYYLVTGQTDNKVAVQSTFRAVYLGLNN